MTDQHDPETLVRESAHQFEHLLGLGHTESGGRLVEDDDTRVPEHRAGDGDGLALTAGQAGDVLPDRGDRPHRETVEGLLRPLLHGVLVELDSVGKLATEEEVVHDVEVVAQREVLIDDLDAERVGLLRVGDVHRLAVEEVFTRVERVDAGDALDERALARSVVTSESRHLSGVDVEVDALEHVHRPEGLRDASQRQQRGWVSRRPVGDFLALHGHVHASFRSTARAGD